MSNDIIDDNPLVIENEDDFGKLNDKNWSSILVKEGLFKEMRDELILNDYPHVQFIHIQERSFEIISSLTISNLPELKFLIIEGDSFKQTTSLNIDSIFMSINDYSDAPFINGKYAHGRYAFNRLYSNHIQYDESISFHSLLQ